MKGGLPPPFVILKREAVIFIRLDLNLWSERCHLRRRLTHSRNPLIRHLDFILDELGQLRKDCIIMLLGVVA
jgi:hypothetical protein